MPNEDINKELMEIINPIGVIAGILAGRKPSLAYLNENNNEANRDLVYNMMEAEEAWINHLLEVHKIKKDDFLKRINTNIAEKVLNEVKANDSASPK